MISEPEWKPFETAPRDGTLIQTFDSEENLWICSYDPDTGEWRSDEGTDIYYDTDLVCWREMPKFPKEFKK